MVDLCLTRFSPITAVTFVRSTGPMERTVMVAQYIHTSVWLSLLVDVVVPYLIGNAICRLADTVTFLIQNVVKLKSDTDFCRHNTVPILREHNIQSTATQIQLVFSLKLVENTNWCRIGKYELTEHIEWWCFTGIVVQLIDNSNDEWNWNLMNVMTVALRRTLGTLGSLSTKNSGTCSTGILFSKCSCKCGQCSSQLTPKH